MVRRRRAVALAAGATLVALAAAELVVRATKEPPVFVGMLPFDPELGFRAPRSYEGRGYDERGGFPYRLNALGFRGPELPAEGAPRVPGRTRVLFVGDSFLNASAVREEELIQTSCVRALARLGVDAEAFTVSCSDYGTAQELLLLERHGPSVRPDVVVLEVYPTNDVANNSLELAGRVETSAGDYVRPYFVPGEDGIERTWAQPARAFLRRHLRSFAHLDRKLIARAAEDERLAWYSPWPERPALDARLRAGLLPEEWLEIFRGHAPDHPWERAWGVTAALLRAVADEARGLGARVLVLCVPACRQVEVSALSRQLDLAAERMGAGPALGALDVNLPERRLAALCAEAGIELRLLLEPLRDAARRGETSYVRNGHLNGRGSTLGGEIAADWIAGGDAFPSARPDAALSAPVRLLPPAASAPRRIELVGAPDSPLLGAGWWPFREAPGGRLTWASGARSATCLPVRAGDRVRVEGWLPPHARLPTTLTLEVGGLGATRRELAAPGPFLVELEPAAGEPEDDFSLVLLTFSATFRPEPGDRREFGAFVSALELRAGALPAPSR